MVCSVKRCLRKSIGRTLVNYDELNTVLIEVKSIVNSRPLTYVSDDSEGVNYTLTPSHLIYGRKMSNIPNVGHYEVISTNENLSTRAKRHRTLLSKQWRRQYLLSLREVHSGHHRNSSERPVKLGDVVVLYDELTKRAFWELGIVTELLTGRDGLTRAAIVKTVNCDKTSYLCRSIKHLIPI